MASHIYHRTTSHRSVQIRSSVAQVLSKLELTHHEDAFGVHSIDTYSDLEMLTDAQMKEMGIWKVGERNRLRRWIIKHEKEDEIHQEKQANGMGSDAAANSDLTRRSLQNRRASYAHNSSSRSSSGPETAPPSQIIESMPGAATNRITVAGAGFQEVNGVFDCIGEWDGVKLYTKSGLYQKTSVTFSLFRCVLLNGTKRWYISIIGRGQRPGTSLDVDFYSSPMVQDLADLPPQAGWIVCRPNGFSPAPRLEIEVEHSIILTDTVTSEVEDELSGDVMTNDSSSAAIALSSSMNDGANNPPRLQQEASTSSPSSGRYERIINIDDAGDDIVCGTYLPDGVYDGVKKYACRSGKSEISLFRCLVRGDQKRWYLSSVPVDTEPGTSLDTDYYSAPLDPKHPERPPEDTWITDHHGTDPPPKLSFVRSHNDSDNGDDHPSTVGSGAALSVTTGGMTVVVGTLSPLSPEEQQRIQQEPENQQNQQHQEQESPEVNQEKEREKEKEKGKSEQRAQASPGRRSGSDSSKSQDSHQLALMAAIKGQPKKIKIDGADVSAVNGLYDPAGTYDGVNKYVKPGFWKGKDRMFTLFRCLVKGNKKRWYISICPPNMQPGTVFDLDFYTAPASSQKGEKLPPGLGWIAVNEGRGKGPKVTIQADDPLVDLTSESSLKEFRETSPRQKAPAAAATSETDYSTSDGRGANSRSESDHSQWTECDEQQQPYSKKDQHYNRFHEANPVGRSIASSDDEQKTQSLLGDTCTGAMAASVASTSPSEGSFAEDSHRGDGEGIGPGQRSSRHHDSVTSKRRRDTTDVSRVNDNLEGKVVITWVIQPRNSTCSTDGTILRSNCCTLL